MALFDALDRNHDGVITRAEFAGAVAPAPAVNLGYVGGTSGLGGYSSGMVSSGIAPAPAVNLGVVGTSSGLGVGSTFGTSNVISSGLSPITSTLAAPAIAGSSFSSNRVITGSEFTGGATYGGSIAPAPAVNLGYVGGSTFDAGLISPAPAMSVGIAPSTTFKSTSFAAPSAGALIAPAVNLGPTTAVSGVTSPGALIAPAVNLGPTRAISSGITSGITSGISAAGVGPSGGLSVKSGERVVGERPISREELLSAGNLTEGPSTNISSGLSGYRASAGISSSPMSVSAPAISAMPISGSAITGSAISGSAIPIGTMRGKEIYGGQVAPAPAVNLGYAGGTITAGGMSGLAAAPAISAVGGSSYQSTGLLGGGSSVVSGVGRPIGGSAITGGTMLGGSSALSGRTMLGGSSGLTGGTMLGGGSSYVGGGTRIASSSTPVTVGGGTRYASAGTQLVGGGGGLFDTLDRNHDGVITRAEFASALR